MTTERIPDYLTTHVLAGERLVFALDHEATGLASGLASGGHRAVTLVKEEGLRVVLVVLGAGGRLDEHVVAGSTTRTRVDARGTPWLVDVAGWEAMMKVCGVAMARLQGHS